MEDKDTELIKNNYKVLKHKDVPKAPAERFTKSMLVSLISDVISLPKSEVKRFVDLIFHIILKEAMSGKNVTIRNFGNFHIYTKKASPRIEPYSNTTLIVEPRRFLRFTPSNYTRFLMNPDLHEKYKRYERSPYTLEHLKKCEEMEKELFTNPFDEWFES